MITYSLSFRSLVLKLQPSFHSSMWAPMAAIGGMHLLVLALLLPGQAIAQDTNRTVSNQVCKKGDWQVSGCSRCKHWPFAGHMPRLDTNQWCMVGFMQASSYFGASVSSDEFTVNTTTDIKSYAMAHVRQKLYPNAVLLVIAIVLLVFFILW